jgi:hypothetical protein
MLFHPKTSADLIDAINDAHDYPGSTIYLEPGFVYELDHADNPDDHGASGLPLIDSDMTIIGNGATIKRVGTASFRIFHITSSGTLYLEGVIIRDGNLQGIVLPGGMHGAGIRNAGQLTLSQCVLINNQNHIASVTGNNNGFGGGIYSTDTAVLTIRNCQFLQNVSQNGAGIHSDGTLDISYSKIANNVGVSAGGVQGSGAGTISNCSISDNTAANGAGLRWGGGSLTVTGSDIFENVATFAGGAIFIDNEPIITLHQNRIFNNSSVHYSTLNRDVYNNPASSHEMDATDNWWGDSKGPSGDGPGAGDSVSSNIDFDPWLESEDCIHEATCNCSINYAANDCEVSENPVSLRFGEKRLEQTDLTLSTPSGVLSFTRIFLQNQQTGTDAFNFMGLGWTHNHHIALSDPADHEKKIRVLTSSGGRVAFKYRETLSGIEYHDADNGAISTLSVDSTSNNARYRLIAGDKSIYVFDSAGKIQLRLWPNGEQWTYTYYISADGADIADKLKQVSDGYGRSLQFAYYRDTYSDTYSRRKLRRVGDQNATGLDGSSPSGNFVEFSYTREHSGGNPTGTEVVLTGVRDVLGRDWTYDYYGKNSGETSTQYLNWMTRRASPSVDTTGDGVADSTLILEKLTYGTHQVVYYHSSCVYCAANQRNGYGRNAGLCWKKRSQPF